jgi:hypothetical protein
VHRRSSFRLLTALALLLGHASGVAHLLLVEHARCPEHGELVHARTHPQARSTVAARTVLSAAPLVDGHADDHCLACSTQSQSSGAARVVGRPMMLFVEVPLLAARDEATVPRQRLLRLAPKTSPPSLG